MEGKIVKRLWLTLIVLVVASVLVACSDNDSDLKEKENEETKTNEWEVSPSFKLGDYDVIGKEDSVAIIKQPIVANQIDNYTFFLWGDDSNSLLGPIRIEATHETTGDMEKVIVANADSENEELVWEGPSPFLSGERAFVTLDLLFPYEGLWKLDVYVNNNKIGNLTVEVNRN